METLTPIQFRRHLGMTQQQVGELLGVSRTSWTEYESGKTALPKYVRASMAFALRLHERGEL